jgi:hypothetical protein
MDENQENAMSRDLKAGFKHIGLFRIRGEGHRDLILAQCSSWFSVCRSPDSNTEYVADLRDLLACRGHMSL